MTTSGIVLIAGYTTRSLAYLKGLALESIPLRMVLFYGACKTARPSDFYEICDDKQWYREQLDCSDINDSIVLDRLRVLRPALIIYSGYGGQLLKEPLFSLRIDILHVHSGWLPHYRGSTTIYYQILHDRCCAASALLLRVGIDTGPIVMRKQFPLPPAGTDIDHVYDAQIRSEVLVHTLRYYQTYGRLPDAIPQQADSDAFDESETYYVIHPVLKHLAWRRIEKL